MKITFLGTSDGVPRPGHFCTSTMIEIGDSIYLIDAGAPVVDQLLKLGKTPNQIKAVFNTHGHGDHLAGMTQLLDLCTWAYRSTSFDVYLTEDKVGEALRSCVEAFVSTPFPCERLRMHTFAAGEIYADENLKVTAIATRHCEPRPSFAFLLESGEKKVLFTGDISIVKNDFPTVAYETPLNLIVCEMAHFGAEHISPILEKVLTKQVIFHHYQLRKERDIQYLMQCANLHFPVSMAQDGDVVQVY